MVLHEKQGRGYQRDREAQDIFSLHQEDDPREHKGGISHGGEFCYMSHHGDDRVVGSIRIGERAKYAHYRLQF